MAFAKPLVLTYAGGTKTLNFINNDSYGSEYWLREATQDFRVKIRHTPETLNKTTGIQMVRHNVEITRTIFGTGGAPDTVQQVYLVYRHSSRDDIDDAAELGAALSALMVEARFQDLGAGLS